MKRTSLMLPAELKARATRAARQRGISFGELVRRSLEAVVDNPATVYDDPLFADDAVFDGPSPTDLAAEHDDYLYGESE